jgi:hypothetical protein
MDWNEIRQKVEANGNILTVKMAVLRDATGKGRLGRKVRILIHKELSKHALGHVPEELSNKQSAWVRLYRRGTPIGDLIEKILTPTKPGDKSLVKRLGDNATD